jgi:hypothetical protein
MVGQEPEGAGIPVKMIVRSSLVQKNTQGSLDWLCILLIEGHCPAMIGRAGEEIDLRYWSSAEVVREVDAAAEAVRRAVLSYLTANLLVSPLKEFDVEIAYIPVIMPPEFHSRYTAILRYDLIDRSIEVRPHLDYAIFLDMGPVTPSII